MIEIKDLLAKWSNVLLSGEAKAETIRGVISSVIGIKIAPEDVKITNNTVYLNIKPIYKSEIFLKKEKIDALLGEAFNQKNIPTLR